jgi:hypothetical protein
LSVLSLNFAPSVPRVGRALIEHFEHVAGLAIEGVGHLVRAGVESRLDVDQLRERLLEQRLPLRLPP